MLTWDEYWEVVNQRRKGRSYQEIVNKLFRTRKTQRSGFWTRKYLSALMKKMDKEAHPEHSAVAEADRQFYKQTAKTLGKALDAFEKEHQAVEIKHYSEKEAKQMFSDYMIEQNRKSQKSPAKEMQKSLLDDAKRILGIPVSNEPIPTYDGVQKPTGETFTEPGGSASKFLGGQFRASYPDFDQIKSEPLLEKKHEHEGPQMDVPSCPIIQMKKMTEAILDLKAHQDIKLKIFKNYLTEVLSSGAKVCLKKS